MPFMLSVESGSSSTPLQVSSESTSRPIVPPVAPIILPSRVKMQNSVLFNEFCPETEEVDAYFDRFDCFVACHGIEDTNKVKFLIASVGAKVYAKLRLLSIPKKPTELTFAEIKKCLEDEYRRTPLVHVAQHRFRQRVQLEGESFREFYCSLKELSRDCGFDTTEKLEDALKSQIISGIRDTRTQSYYFMTAKLSLKDVIAKAEVDEVTAGGINHFRNSDSVPNAKEQMHKISDQVKRKDQFSKKPARFRRFNHPKSFSNAPKLSNQAADSSSSSITVVCYRCAKPGHKAPECRFKNATCNKCGRPGHIAPACGLTRESLHAGSSQKSSYNGNPSRTPAVHQLEQYEVVPIYSLREQPVEVVEMKSLRLAGNIGVADPSSKVLVQLSIEGKSVRCEADSGSKYAVMSKLELERLGITKELEPCFVVLQTYSRDFVNVLGCINVDVSFRNRFAHNLRLLIVDGNYDTVFGREWLVALNIALVFGPTSTCINSLSLSFELGPALTKLTAEFQDIYHDSFSIVKNAMFNVTLKPGTKPIFCRHRNIVYAFRDAVDREIDRLVDAKIYEPVDSSDWATPLVVVQKSNKTVRLVGDYSVTLNNCIVHEDYPIPNVEEILYDFGCCKNYSKFDIREAYMHMPVSEETAKLLTVNTPRGLFKVNRMNYGIQSAPAKWQRYVETILKPVAGCRSFYDDIKISSENDHEHLKRVKQFYQICRENGIRLRREKCQLLTNELEYLGFKMNEQGVHKTAGKVQAVLNAPAPKNVTEVKSFAGLVGFYGRFVPNLSTMFHPINELLRKETPFVWSKRCDDAFNAIKREIASPRVLCHFDPSKPLILATDASPYAIGAVLSHQYGQFERPIAFASRTLSKSECNYSQIDKESLAIFWGVKRFFNYLFARHFTLYVDCKPLQAIFAPNVAKPALSATRLLHYALFLQGFDYSIRYRRSEDHGNADFLSRFPVEETSVHLIDEPTIINLHQIQMLPIQIDQLAKETQSDPETAQLLSKLQNVDEKLSNAEYRELAKYSIENGCILFGTRVYVPKKFRGAVLTELHMGHIGISKMKGLARTFVFWPRIDEDIERIVRACKPCQANANVITVIPHPWMQPSAPWERVHVDYAGPFQGHSFLVVVDSFSKWPEVFPVPSSQLGGTDSKATIDRLRECFARFGCPTTLVSDNGTQFASREFRDFCQRNFVKQIFTAPYFPQSNGLAERFVQMVKRALRIAVMDTPSDTMHQKVQTFLLAYRRAPVMGLGRSPAEMMLQRRIRTRIDLLSGPAQSCGLSEPSPSAGQAVWFRTFHGSRNWDQGTIVQQHGDVMFEVKDMQGRTHRRHKSQIRRDTTTRSQPPSQASTADSDWSYDSSAMPAREPVIVEERPEPEADDAREAEPPAPEVPVPPPGRSGIPVADPRRSARPKKPPVRLSP